MSVGSDVWRVPYSGLCPGLSGNVAYEGRLLFVAERRSHASGGFPSWEDAYVYDDAGEAQAAVEEAGTEPEDEDVKPGVPCVSCARTSSTRDASGRRPVPEVSQKNAMALTSTCGTSHQQSPLGIQSERQRNTHIALPKQQTQPPKLHTSETH